MLHLNSDTISIFHQARAFPFRNFDIHIEYFYQKKKKTTFVSIPEFNYFFTQVGFLLSYLR